MTLLRFALMVVALLATSCTSPSAQWQTLRPGTPVPERLSPTEMQYARTAWRYFVVNEDPVTGLVNSVNNFKSATLWDEGAYLLAIVAAHRLGIVSRTEAEDRAGRVLTSLHALPLFKAKLPNKVYNTSTLQMTDYANRPTPRGIGWSALDIMRLVSGLLIIADEFPDQRAQARNLIARWDLDALVSRGRFQGRAVRGKVQSKSVQEGRIGYEQYAATVGLHIGLRVALAARYQPILRTQAYKGILLPGDKRTADTHGVSSITTSEPFLLEALEYGWRPDAQTVALAVYGAQIFRYNDTGILTALSEDHIKGKPYFAYNAILVDHRPFVTVTAQRVDVSGKRGLSTKASFGWWALMRDDYSDKLVRRVRHLQTDRGWYAGLFEATGRANEVLTLNTNAVVLEALHYKAFGPMFRP